MKKELVELDGKMIEFVTKLDDDFYENNDVFYNELEDTIDLTKDIETISKLESSDDYE